MQALRFSEAGGLRLEQVALPVPDTGEALIRVLRAGVCSTDTQILRGYVPGYDFTLGHEFVGVVVRVNATDLGSEALVGQRVVGEINCGKCTHPDPVFSRNHTPDRTVLGIIGKDGALADYCTLPTRNLHAVPETLTDQEACFAEPLAAAFRILEQRVIRAGDAVAVLGDGKLGLLIAQLLVLHGHDVTHLGRHERKLKLVEGTKRVVVTSATEFAHAFDVVVEASGSTQGILLAMDLCRPLGTVVLKSTCSSVGDATAPVWSTVGNGIVVNEKILVGSRCGPFAPALEALLDPRVRRLVNSMVEAVLPLQQGVAAIKRAQQAGALKVQVVPT